MPAVLARLFSTQDVCTSSGNALQTNQDEREQELKKTLGIRVKPAMSVTELEKQFLQLDVTNDMSTFEHSIRCHPMVTSSFVNNQTNHVRTPMKSDLSTIHSTNDNRLMTPAEFQTKSPGRTMQTHIRYVYHIEILVLLASTQLETSAQCDHCQNPTMNHLSKEMLRQLLLNMLQVTYDTMI
jgi:hypothetical protein